MKKQGSKITANFGDLSPRRRRRKLREDQNLPGDNVGFLLQGLTTCGSCFLCSQKPKKVRCLFRFRWLIVCRVCQRTTNPIMRLRLLHLIVDVLEPRGKRHDCGIFVLMNAQIWDGRTPPEYGQSKIPNIRKLLTHAWMDSHKNDIPWKTILKLK